jgi:hypothetical protein
VDAHGCAPSLNKTASMGEQMFLVKTPFGFMLIQHQQTFFFAVFVVQHFSLYPLRALWFKFPFDFFAAFATFGVQLPFLKSN